MIAGAQGNGMSLFDQIVTRVIQLALSLHPDCTDREAVVKAVDTVVERGPAARRAGLCPHHTRQA